MHIYMHMHTCKHTDTHMYTHTHAYTNTVELEHKRLSIFSLQGSSATFKGSMNVSQSHLLTFVYW